MIAPLFLRFFIVSLLGLIFFPALAQTTEQSLSPSPPVMPDGNALPAPLSADLLDSDLSVDLATEALPTVEKFSYRWELFRDRLAGLFTFNQEKKSDWLLARLHRLDRKMAACAAIGDEDCLARVAKLRQQATERTAAYIQKKQALRERLLDRFLAWREHREAKVEAWQEQARQLRENKSDLIVNRQAIREAARERRRQYLPNKPPVVREWREQTKQNLELRPEEPRQPKPEIDAPGRLNQKQRRP